MAAPRRPGQASFFFWDAQFRNDAVKVMPGEYFVHDEDILITTTLGSCIAACLYDRERRIGGMNHFMLPLDSLDTDGQIRDRHAGRYGCHAMEILINELMRRGASRARLEAKVFGGGAVISGMNSLNVGARNTRFVLDYLDTERIPVVSKDVLGNCSRKLCYLPRSGKAMLKRLAMQAENAITAAPQPAELYLPVGAQAGAVDLF